MYNLQKSAARGYLVRPRRWFMALALLTAGQASAGTEPFSEARFTELQAQDALILVDVHADWCPTCKRQTVALDAYEAAHPDVALNRLVVDFDKQKEWVKHFKAPRQSTLLIYRGKAKKWFSVGEIRSEKIAEALNAAAAP